MSFIIAKRYHHGDLIAYLRADNATSMTVFDTRDLAQAWQIEDQADAMQLADDWKDYWATKGFPGFLATVEAVTELEQSVWDVDSQWTDKEPNQ